ncbi:hypothetical protein SLA2020_484300 [Shorea laevis]
MLKTCCCWGTQSLVGRPKWKKPDVGMVKGNWDAAIDFKNQRMGVGLVVRNSTGSVLAAMCSSVPFITDPTTAEVVALQKAVSVCLDLGFQRIQLEGDALEIVQALQNPTPCWRR